MRSYTQTVKQSCRSHARASRDSVLYRALTHYHVHGGWKLPVGTHVTCMQGEKLKRNAGDRLPASYINFYRGNGCAVIPAFGEATDEP